MIFNFKNRDGSATLISILVLASVVGVFLVTVLNQIDRKTQLARKDVFESSVVVSSHALAALFKQDLLANYMAYEAGVANGWSTCPHAGASVTDFLEILNSPIPDCSAVEMPMTYFRKLDPSAPPVITVGVFKNLNLVPIAELNRSSLVLRVTEFNSDPSRNTVIAEVAAAANSGTRIPSQKTIPLVLDLARTIAAPAIVSSCRMCHAIPGSVCCDRAPLAYLERGTGRVVRAEWNRTTKLLTLTPFPGDVPDPRSISVKNLDTGRMNYYLGSFCVPFTKVCPSNRTQYVIDAATAKSKNYYLTVHGRVLEENTPTPLLIDPRIESIAFDGSNWLMLRSDGAVLEGGEEMTQPFTEIADLRLPMAEKLAVGRAPPRLP